MRRPFGVAAIDLTPIIKKPEDFKNNLDLPFILCEKENLDTTLKKLINNKDVGKIDSKLAVSVEVLHGDTKQIREEYPHLVHGNVPIARKMGFPEVIFPGDVRNDMYLTLVNGEFSKGLKSGDKNIEVMVCVCNEKGIVVPDVITLGAGYAMTSEYKSVIYYHEDKPKWNETFKVQVPIEEFKQCHLRFTFKHRSSNEAKDRAEKPFALSYVKLMQNDGTTLHHTSHKLLVYKIDQKKYDKDSPLSYLSLPSKVSDLEPNSKPSAVGLSLSSKDFFVIETNLCSTKLTQDGGKKFAIRFILKSLNFSLFFFRCSFSPWPSELVFQSRCSGKLSQCHNGREARRGCEIPTRYSRCSFFYFGEFAILLNLKAIYLMKCSGLKFTSYSFKQYSDINGQNGQKQNFNFNFNFKFNFNLTEKEGHI